MKNDENPLKYKRIEITQDRLKYLLDYDQYTGIFINRVNRTNIKAGSVSGKADSHGYVVMMVDGRTYKAHRLAWLYMNGSIPCQPIDHIDRNRSNNAFSNLRLASDSQNCQNSFRSKTSASGLKGVSLPRGCRRWIARIMVNGKNIDIGLFDSAEAAHKAYINAANIYFGEFACYER